MIKLIRKLVAAFVTILFAASLHSTAFAEFIPVDGDTTYINRNFKAGDILRVTGEGYPPSNWDQRDNFAKTFARQAARLDALRYLVELIDGVTVEPIEPIPDTVDRVVTHISQDSNAFRLLEKTARQIGDVKFSFNNEGKLTCRVTMEIVFPTDWHK